MMSDKPIDLHQELVDVFQKEQMLAFFDFKLNVDGTGAPASGLCRISKPKDGNSASKYFSLLFIIDTPDETVRESADRKIAGIQWDHLKTALSGAVAVLPLPQLNSTADILLKEADVYVRSIKEPVRLFVLRELYPAIVKVTGIEGGELVFWDDFSDVPRIPATRRQKGRHSFLERLRRFFEV